MPGSIGSVLGVGSSAEQFLLWNVGSQVVSAILAPVLTTLEQEIWQGAVTDTAGNVRQVLSPQVLAEMVVRGFSDAATAANDALKSGIAGPDFASLVALAGDAPAPGELAVALRRRLIPEVGAGAAAVSFDQGIREGRLADKWTEMIKQLATIWPTPADALDALLEGQIDQPTALDLFTRFGGDPQFFQMLFDTRGTAPTPTEALELVRRGIIGIDGTGPAATSYTQAFLEGPWRNKWLTPFEGLLEYVPPPRTVTALERSGAITTTEAQALYQKSGLTPALAAAYAKSASHDKLAGTKALAEGAILGLYEAHGIDAATATAHLTALGYDPADVALLIAYVDLKRELAAFNSAVNRVGTFYVAHKITRAGAAAALTALATDPAHAAHLLATWDAERAVNVKQLSEGQIVDAYARGVRPQAWCETQLRAIGYSAEDAWVLLSNRAHGPIPGDPGPAGSGPGSVP